MNGDIINSAENPQPKQISIGERIRNILKKKIVIIPGFVLLLTVGFLFLYPYFIAGNGALQLEEKKGHHIGSAESLKIMSLNIAHGRGRGPHQLRQKEHDFKLNLDRISEVIKREQPAVIAFQEADGPSFWSGNFNHIEYIVQKTEYPFFCRGEHVKGLGLSYGTALMSGIKLRDAVSVTFSPSGLTPPKGFVICTIEYPSKRDAEIDVVSVHLDYSRRSVRKKQIKELIAHVSARKAHLIVMGDFNCEYTGREDTLRILVKELNLKTFSPESKDMITFPRFSKRLDWILISHDLEFASYHTLPDPVSDHFGVIAEIQLKE